MKIDFYVSVIDNYGDMGFALNLADTFYFHDKNLEIRFFSDDEKLFKLMSKKLLCKKNICYYELQSVKKYTPNTYIFNFFDRKIEREFLSQFDFSINIINFSYFLLHSGNGIFSPSIESLHGKTYLFGPKNNITVKYCIPSLLPNTGGIVINPNTEKKREKQKINPVKEKRHFMEKYGISLKNELFEKKWISLFLYKETFESIKKSNVFDSSDFVFFTFSDDAPNKKNIIKLPFLSLYDYGLFLSICDMNFVRGENSLVEAILAGKPFIWDIYKEFNNAHKEKIIDFTEFLKQFNFSSEYFLNFEGFNGESKDICFQKAIFSLEKYGISFSELSIYAKANCDMYKKINKYGQI